MSHWKQVFRLNSASVRIVALAVPVTLAIALSGCTVGYPAYYGHGTDSIFYGGTYYTHPYRREGDYRDNRRSEEHNYRERRNYDNNRGDVQRSDRGRYRGQDQQRGRNDNRGGDYQRGDQNRGGQGDQGHQDRGHQDQGRQNGDQQNGQQN